MNIKLEREKEKKLVELCKIINDYDFFINCGYHRYRTKDRYVDILLEIDDDKFSETHLRILTARLSDFGLHIANWVFYHKERGLVLEAKWKKLIDDGKREK